MAGPLATYALINAKLRARISMILPDELFAQLAKAPSLDATFALLRDTPFAGLEEVYSRTGDLKQVEWELLKSEIELYRSIKPSLHPNSLPLVDALLSRFEIDNLKNAIRVYFEKTQRHLSMEDGTHYVLYDRIIEDLPIDLIVNAQGFEDIAEACRGTSYEEIVREAGPRVEAEGSLFPLETAFDRAYYARLLSTIQRLNRKDRTLALRLIGVEIDLQNISWIIRFKRFYDLPVEAIQAMMIPGGFGLKRTVIEELVQAQNVTSVLQDFVKVRYAGLSSLLSSETSDSTSRLLLIERILEEIKRQEIQRILAGYPFTIGILMVYFMLKSDELKHIRTVINTRHYGKPIERIEGVV